ncbi:MAG: hypothetical protein JOZ83_14245 [Silvibacterium sp.]|nr:hypothetical protein [Silvibacterium sp.]
MLSHSDIQRRVNSVIAELLLTDTEMALTFLDLADTTRVPENRTRRHKEAKKAYETIMSLIPKVAMKQAERELLDQRLGRLRRRLLKAG